MSKRTATVVAEEDNYLDDLVQDKQSNRPSSSKHTLDSDEEDSGDDDAQYVLNDNDIEGEEEGIARVDGETKFTPFNMKEEMEEGHFDADGHYLWKKGAEIRDNWLDNIDWVKIKKDPNYKDEKDTAVKGLGDSDSDEDEKSKPYDLSATYQSIFNMMQPKETIKKTLQRFGKKTTKLTTAQRWKMKKAGTVDESSEMVTKLTALANEILTREGNMDIYDETYEMIQKKLNESKANAVKDELDMYADDFDSKEKDKLIEGNSGNEPNTATVVKPGSSKDQKDESKQPLMWEYKEQQEAEKIAGPFTTEQMRQFAEEGKFNSGAFVRKVSSDDTRFYSAARIDFDLYL